MAESLIVIEETVPVSEAALAKFHTERLRDEFYKMSVRWAKYEPESVLAALDAQAARGSALAQFIQLARTTRLLF